MLSPEKIAKYSSKEFLHDLFPSGLISFKLDGTIISINQTLADWVGKDIDQIMGTNFKTLLEQPSKIYYDLFVAPQLSLHGVANEYSLRFFSEKGNYDALLNARSYGDEIGEVSVVVASIQKIIHRKKYETELLLEKRNADFQAKMAQSEKRRFEFLFNSFPNNFWTTSATGDLSNMNSKAAKLLESLPSTHLGLFGAVDKLDRGKALRTWRKCLKQGQPFNKELRLLDPLDNPEWHVVTAEPYYNDSNEIEMWFCSTINIHLQKLLQLANQHELRSHLSSAYHNLDQKNGLLSQIATDQSHMVRKPLANIIGLVALIQMDQDSPDPLLLEMIGQSAKELDEMIRKISEKTTLT